LPFVRIRLTARKPKNYSEQPETLGEHIRKRRVELRLTLKQAAAEIGVTDYTVINWEYNRTEPPVTVLPAVVRFLGYDPFPSPTTLAEHLLAKRRAMGWTIKQATKALSVDPGTWRDWEAGKVVLYRKHRNALAALLGVGAVELDDTMRKRWNAAHAPEGQPRPVTPPDPSRATWRQSCRPR
jgi:transcriptional regulator with XRE-family HTH domain